MTKIWEWPSALSASTLTITLLLTNAQKSAAQAAPLSAGFNGLKEPKMMKKKRTPMKVIVRKKKMRMKNLCGEKQHLASLKVNAPKLAVSNVVKAGMTAILMPKNIVAKTKQSTSIRISVAKRCSRKRVWTCV